MSVVAAAETEPVAALPSVTESLFRHARGERLFSMFGRLQEFDRQVQGIIVPTDSERNVSPRLVVVRSKELLAKSALLGLDELGAEDFYGDLQDRVPGLADHKPITVERLDFQRNRKGFHLSLLLDAKSTSELVQEQDDVFTALEDMAGVTLDEHHDWRTHDPDIMAMIARPRIKNSAMRLIASYIGKQLPMEAILDSLFNPAQRNGATPLAQAA